MNEKSKKVLACLHQSGPATWMDMEMKLATSGLQRVAQRLSSNHYIKAIGKKDGLALYEIAKLGLQEIGALEKKYDEPGRRPDLEWSGFAPPCRPHAMDAYKLPSRIGKRLTYRDGSTGVVA